MTTSVIKKSIDDHPLMKQFKTLLSEHATDLKIQLIIRENGEEYALASNSGQGKAPELMIDTDSEKESLLALIRYTNIDARNDAEKCLWIKRCHAQFNDYSSLPDIAKELGLPHHKAAINELVRISSLDDSILNFCAEKNMKRQLMAQCLRFSEELLLFLVTHAQALHLTANYFISFAEKFSRFQVKVGDKQALEHDDIISIIQSDKPSVERRSQLNAYLDEQIYETLHQAQHDIEAQLKNLNAADLIHIDYDKSLENRYLDLTCRLTSKDDIEALQEWLSRESEQIMEVLRTL